MCNEYIDKIDAKATQLVADIADGGKYEGYWQNGKFNGAGTMMAAKLPLGVNTVSSTRLSSIRMRPSMSRTSVNPGS